MKSGKEYSLSESLKKAVNAGVDIFIVANNKADQTDEVMITLATLVKNGDITQEKINEIYNRITFFKRNKLENTHPTVSELINKPL